MRKTWWTQLYAQVLIALALGVACGMLAPEAAKALKPLGDAFIKLIKMVIAPVVFCTVVHGIASVREAGRIGRVGWKALVYFEVVSTFALALGLIVANVFRTGEGFNLDLATLNTASVSDYAKRAEADSITAHLMQIIPDSFLGAFVGGDLLQVLLLAVLTGFAINALPDARRLSATHAIESLGDIFFGVVALVVKAAPLGAFGAMAFTIGAYGLGALVKLGELVATFYLTAAGFVLIVLGGIARWCGFSILRFMAYIREELLIVLGTSSSETALPQLMHKLREAGCAPSVVGLTVPLGYSFNLDGTNIYMTLAALFLAYATNTDLTLTQQLTLLLVAMVTSKGASGVTGAGFVTLAATLSVVPGIPIEALAVLVGIDKFMSECRALTNFIGNGVACVAVSKWEGALDDARLAAVLAKPAPGGRREVPAPGAGDRR